MEPSIAEKTERSGTPARNLLLVVLPYMVAKQTDTKKKGSAAFLLSHTVS